MNGTPTLLVIDDEKDILTLIELVMANEGYRVLTSLNGEGLQNLLSGDPPDIIVIDINLDGKSGADICRSIKGDGKLSGIPVIMFSANYDLEEVSKKCGANDFLAKPFDTASMKQKLNRLLEPNPE